MTPFRRNANDLTGMEAGRILIVPDGDDTLIVRLKRQAATHGRSAEAGRRAALRRTLWEAASGIPPGDLRGMIHMAPDLDHTPDDMIAAMEGGDT